jgi:Nucleoside diphosphate kinase
VNLFFLLFVPFVTCRFEVRAHSRISVAIVISPRVFEEPNCMQKTFFVFTTFFFSLITITEAFQITKLFNSPRKNSKSLEMASEQTFIAVKPDGVLRGLVGEIIGRFEKRGYIKE